MNIPVDDIEVPFGCGEANEYTAHRLVQFAKDTSQKLKELTVAERSDLNRPRLSVIVVHYNDPEHLVLCVDALRCDLRVDEIVVVDNGSEPNTIKAVTASRDDVKIVCSPVNLGFGGGANLGAAHATGDLIAFLNPDTIPDSGCMTALAQALSENGGVAGPQVRTGPDGVPEYGCTIDRMLLPSAMDGPGDPLYVQGCCLATTRSCFDAVGGFDDRYFLFQEDVEFCWQALRRGFPVVVVPGAGLAHAGGAVAGGGYRRSGRIETSSRRILLRERNSWAVIIACAPRRCIPQLLALSLLRTVVFTGILLFYGRPRDASRLWWAGLAWNVVGLRPVLERRRRFGVTHSDEQGAWSRVERRFYLWDLARKGERLRFVDMKTVKN